MSNIGRVDGDELSAIVADAFIYGYPMLFNYKTFYTQAVDPGSPGYAGGFGRFRHYQRAFTPADVDIVTPNNDTPYSWAWLDLRTEPWVLSIPAAPDDRYIVFQWFDLFTYNFAYVGVLTTGRDAGHHLLAHQAWDGDLPDGISSVSRSETDIIGTLGRTGLDGPDDLANVIALQRHYVLRPLSEFAGQRPPAPAPPLDWPAWPGDDTATSHHFIGLLNTLLTHCQPPHPSETDLLARFATAGIGAGLAFDPSSEPAARLAAIDAGVAEGKQRLAAAVRSAHSSVGLFGTREILAGDYLKRATAAAVGIYGNTADEAIYVGWHALADGTPLTGDHDYEIRFPPGQLPPVRLFWSATLYRLPERHLVDNPIDRYSIGDRTPNLHLGDDGSLTLHVQHDHPTHPDANWLPAPHGPFNIVLRLYGPDPAVLDGTWQLPPITATR